MFPRFFLHLQIKHRQDSGKLIQWLQITSGIYFLKHETSGGTSVIIANHSAKEETNVTFRNCESRASAVYQHISGNNSCYVRTERNVQNNYGNIVYL